LYSATEGAKKRESTKKRQNNSASFKGRLGREDRGIWHEHPSWKEGKKRKGP